MGRGAISYGFTPQSRQRGADGTYFPIPTPAWVREEEEGLPSPQALSGLRSWGRAVVVESWQGQPAAAGRVEKMISNPEKCRPDEGPESALGGEREGGGPSG